MRPTARGCSNLVQKTGTIDNVLFHPDNKRILVFSTARNSNSFSRKLTVWDAQNGTFLCAMPWDNDSLVLSFSPDGQKLIALGFNNLVKEWLLPTPELSNPSSSELCLYSKLLKDFMDSRFSKSYEGLFEFLGDAQTRKTERDIFAKLDKHSQAYLNLLIPGRSNNGDI